METVAKLIAQMDFAGIVDRARNGKASFVLIFGSYPEDSWSIFFIFYK